MSHVADGIYYRFGVNYRRGDFSKLVLFHHSLLKIVQDIAMANFTKDDVKRIVSQVVDKTQLPSFDRHAGDMEDVAFYLQSLNQAIYVAVSDFFTDTPES